MSIELGSGIACPTCGKTNSTVKDSRSKEGGAYVRRRRLCESCGNRFTTRERAISEDDETQFRVDLHRAIMASAEALEALARSVITPFEIANLTKFAQVGAVAIQAMIDEDATSGGDE